VEESDGNIEFDGHRPLKTTGWRSTPADSIAATIFLGGFISAAEGPIEGLANNNT
jgi:hypothetical protein